MHSEKSDSHCCFLYLLNKNCAQLKKAIKKQYFIDASGWSMLLKGDAEAKIVDI